MYQKALNKLLQIEPSLAQIASYTTVEWLNHSRFPIAGITTSNCKLHLIISKPKFRKLNIDERVAVLAHEYAHPLLGHLDIRRYESDDPHLVAIAHDLAVNSLLSDWSLPKSFVTPQSFGLECGLSTEQYIDKLKAFDMKKLKKMVFIPKTNPSVPELADSRIIIAKAIKPKSADINS